MRLCRLVDVLEQTPGPDLREPPIRIDVTSRMRDMSSVRPRSAIAVPAMLWPPPLMLSNSPWSRANPTAAATSRPRSAGARMRGLSRPCRSRRARPRPSPRRPAQQRTLDLRVELVELLRRQPHQSAVESGDVDGARLRGLRSRRRLSLSSCHSSRSRRLHATPLAGP